MQLIHLDKVISPKQEKVEFIQKNDTLFPPDEEVLKISIEKTSPIDGKLKKREESKKPHSVPKKTVEKIIGFTEDFKENKMYVIVKFKESNRNCLVLNEFMRKSYPQELIDYYEANIEWD